MPVGVRGRVGFEVRDDPHGVEEEEFRVEVGMAVQEVVSNPNERRDERL